MALNLCEFCEFGVVRKIISATVLTVWSWHIEAARICEIAFVKLFYEIELLEQRFKNQLFANLKFYMKNENFEQKFKNQLFTKF